MVSFPNEGVLLDSQGWSYVEQPPVFVLNYGVVVEDPKSIEVVPATDSPVIRIAGTKDIYVQVAIVLQRPPVADVHLCSWNNNALAPPFVQTRGVLSQEFFVL